MLRLVRVGLLCLVAIAFSIDRQVLAESAGGKTSTAAEVSSAETQADSRPALDLIAETENSPSGKSNSDGKAKSETSATSATTLSVTSTSTSGSASATGGAAPRQPILPYNGTFDTSIPIRLPGFHGIEPKITFHYNSAQGIRDFARPGGELGIGWNISGLSVIEAASTGRGVPKFDGTDSYLRDGWEIITCTSSMTNLDADNRLRRACAR